MLVSLAWLKDFLPLEGIAPETISDVLTLAGLEVDRVTKTNSSFEGVVVGEVLTCTPHPEADRLKITTVSDGTHTFQVVCGATNCRVGIKTAFARIGAKLKDPEGKEIVIKKSMLRGQESQGMLCSAKELGIAHKEVPGILEITQETILGTPIEEIFGDTIFELSLTPNLGHCLSIRGIARQLSALLQIPMHKAKIDSPLHEPLSSDVLSISLEAEHLCPLYACCLIKNITVGESPDWLKQRLESCGMRSINNVVDITNYVLLELGQPLHAFDYNKLTSKNLIVKELPKEEEFRTLDDVVRKVPKGALVICDEEQILALAGIMGGLSTCVDTFTTDILLECAYFDSSCVRKTSKAMHLRSESSNRFEKGADRKAVLDNLNKAAKLMADVSQGTLDPRIGMEELFPYQPKKISFRPAKITSLLGITLSFSEIESIFKRLDILILKQSEELFVLEIPSYRNDIVEEIDVIEEIAILYGYNNIQKAEIRISPSNIPHHPRYLFENRVRMHMVSEGLQEFMSCDLIGPKLLDLLEDYAELQNTLIHVLQPSSIDQSILRPSFLPGMLSSYKTNLDQQRFDIAAFEIGKTHRKIGEEYVEKLTLGLLLAGKTLPATWSKEAPLWDFFTLKGIVQDLLLRFEVPNTLFQKSSYSTLHPGRQAIFATQDHVLGSLGEIHPAILAKLDIEHRVYYAEIDLEMLFAKQGPQKQMSPLKQFPSSSRDWTVTLKKSYAVGPLLDYMRHVPSKFLENVALLSVYENSLLGEENWNVTFRLIYRDTAATLDLASVEKEHHRLLAMIQEKIQNNLSS